MGIDTGACHGNALTCLRLPQRQIISLPAGGGVPDLRERLFDPD